MFISPDWCGVPEQGCGSTSAGGTKIFLCPSASNQGTYLTLKKVKKTQSIKRSYICTIHCVPRVCRFIWIE